MAGLRGGSDARGYSRSLTGGLRGSDQLAAL
jgi:hypothetical protein